MNRGELDTDQLLGALGELQHRERSELMRLEQAADALAAREPKRAQELEDRLMNELFSADTDLPLRAASDAGSFKDLRVAFPAQATRRPRTVAKLASAAAIGVALAASAMLWVRQPPVQPFEVTYTLVAPAPDARARSAEETNVASGVYSLGRSLRFALRPASRYEGPLSVTCYAVQGDRVVPLDSQVELDPAGGARVVLSADALSRAVHEGSWELRFYVSPPSATAVSAAHVRARQCPSDTRCLSFHARFVQP